MNGCQARQGLLQTVQLGLLCQQPLVCRQIVRACPCAGLEQPVFDRKVLFAHLQSRLRGLNSGTGFCQLTALSGDGLARGLTVGLVFMQRVGPKLKLLGHQGRIGVRSCFLPKGAATTQTLSSKKNRAGPGQMCNIANAPSTTATAATPNMPCPATCGASARPWPRE